MLSAKSHLVEMYEGPSCPRVPKSGLWSRTWKITHSKSPDIAEFEFQCDSVCLSVAAASSSAQADSIKNRPWTPKLAIPGMSRSWSKASRSWRRSRTSSTCNDLGVSRFAKIDGGMRPSRWWSKPHICASLRQPAWFGSQVLLNCCYAYLHTCIHTYIHTQLYIHAYIYILWGL